MASDARLTEPWMRRRRRAMRFGSRITTLIGRLTGGRFIEKMAPGGAPPVFLLTTTGRRSGKRRTVALSYLLDGDGIPITVGTHGGLPTEPAWVLNLRADPKAVMEKEGASTRVVAEFVDPVETEDLWRRILADYPIYEDPLATANREVPIIRLRPDPGTATPET